MGIFDGILGSVLGLVGSAFGASESVKGQQQANESNMDIAQANNQFNAQQAELNRNFQEQMANTTWQRGVADMQAAGLNPMLAYSQGGNPSPSGSTASAAPVAPMQNTRAIGAEIGMRGIQTAAQVSNLEADTDLKGKMGVKELASAGQLDATRKNIEQEMTGFPQRIAKLVAETGALDAQALRDASQTDLNEQAFKVLNPAKLAVLKEEAAKLTNEARLLGLKVPEGLQEFRFFSTEEGARAVRLRNAPTPSKIGSELFLQGGDALEKGTSSAAQAIREGIGHATRRQTTDNPWTGAATPW